MVLKNQKVLEAEFRIWQEMKDKQEIKDFEAFTKRIMKRLEKQNTSKTKMNAIKESLNKIKEVYENSK